MTKTKRAKVRKQRRSRSRKMNGSIYQSVEPLAGSILNDIALLTLAAIARSILKFNGA